MFLFQTAALFLTLNGFAGMEAPELVVQRQVEAYNTHDLDGFAACYAEGIEFMGLNGKALAEPGLKALRKDYGEMFRKYPKLRVSILNRILQGRYVIDQERVEGLGSEPVTATAIYEVSKGKIVKVWFL